MEKNKKEYSAEELSTLEDKFLAGESLTKEELIAIGEAEEEEKEATGSDLQKPLEQIADIMLQKAKGGNVSGGKPFDPTTAKPLPVLTMAEKAEQYYKGVDLPNFPWPGIHVTSDLQVFFGNVQGENALANHKAANPGMTHESFPKPK